MDIQKEREAFEDLYCKNHTGLKQSDLAKFRTLSGYSFSDSLKINVSWEAWQAAKAQAIPDGFVLVPKEPTQELLNKMQDFFIGAFENGLTGGQSIHCSYIAIIEAQEQNQ
jgi:hypothetical protein